MKNNTPVDSPLGKESVYPDRYAPELLFPIARQQNRDQLNIQANRLPFDGWDVWNGYELSWLNEKGKPCVAIGRFLVPCQSPCIIESKSFKLYLNSFNQTRFSSTEEVIARLKADLSQAAGLPVEVVLESVDVEGGTSSSGLQDWVRDRGFVCLDELDIDVNVYQRQPELIRATPDTTPGQFACYSHLLRSNCPVTGQPDWATVFVCGEGEQVDQESLLRYLVSFRTQQDFHEHCVETIFMDLWRALSLQSLTVYARYTRRGGLDINPMRTTEKLPLRWQLLNARLARQ